MASRFDDEEKPPKVVELVQTRKPHPSPPFPYIWASDTKLVLDTRYLIKGLIEQGSFSLVYGPSGSGKSFFTADLCQHIATGQLWRGRKVNKSLVVYIASEAGSSILKRFVGWREHRMGEAVGHIPLAILTRGPNLILKQQIEDLRSQLLYMQEEAQLPLGLVTFDTLSRSMPGGDENKPSDMTEAISVADHLRDEFKSATTFVHHSGKEVERGARGHSSLFAAADCVLRIENRAATLEKIRDGVAGEQFPFSLKPIELGLDSEGEPVTTCLLETSETTDISKRELKGLGKNQKSVLDALRTLVSDSGTRSIGTSAIPAGVLTASFEDLCKRMEPKYPALKPWNVKRKVNDALNGLEGSGFAGLHGNTVWLR